VCWLRYRMERNSWIWFGVRMDFLLQSMEGGNIDTGHSSPSLPSLLVEVDLSICCQFRLRSGMGWGDRWDSFAIDRYVSNTLCSVQPQCESWVNDMRESDRKVRLIRMQDEIRRT